MISITPVEAFQDNYIWALHNAAGQCVVVDPGDAQVVESFLAQQKLQLAAILITHHHPDHTGGLKALCAQRDIPVYGPHNPTIHGITQACGNGDHVALNMLGLSFQVLEVPGHTLDHIAFYCADDKLLFCGDTLFHCGCGRLFEGTPEQMLQSLDTLAALPGDTGIYCTHEYTLANMAFARAVEPDNTALQTAQQKAQARREQQQPTLPAQLDEQLRINPFLRSRQAPVMAAARSRGATGDDPVSVFAHIRQWKDSF